MTQYASLPGRMTSAQLDRVFRALSDGTRRRILGRLSSGPLTVSKIAEPFRMSLPAISQHLSVLERAGLISRTSHGRVRLCSLESVALRQVDRWLDPYRAYWTVTLRALGEQALRGP